MDCDFLVIGGGIAGISVAARLAALGSVIVLEAEPALAFHASGRSAAMYEPQYGPPPIVALSLASGDEFRSLPGLLTLRGLMLVARADQEAAFRADLAAMAFHPVPPDEARARVPVLNPATVALTAVADHGWDIDTDRLIQHFARAVRANGRIETGARVTVLAAEPGGWRATHAGGSVTGRLLFNAAGAWADEVARLAGVRPLGLQPMRRSMARIPAPGGHDVSGWPMIFGPGEDWYAKPDAGALIVSPAEEHPMAPHDAWADDMVLAEGLARYEEMVTEPVTRLLASWAGLRSFLPDRAPALGRDPGNPSFFWVAGQGGYGFQSAPAASQLVADLVAGRAPAVDAATVAAVDPARPSLGPA
jgi:glycine/D-amino acid oxidase-like deaminating enzyme